MSLFGKIRIIPITITAIAIILVFKVAEITDKFKFEDIALQFSKASAQDNPPAADSENNTPDENTGSTETEEKNEETEEKKGAEKTGTEADKTTNAKDKAKKSVKDAKEGSKTNKDNPDNDPTLFTQAEIDLLQELGDRREAIEQRAKQLSLREGLLKAAEKRIAKRIDELKQLQTTIQGLIQTHDSQRDSKMKSLVKIYEAMKPKDAARIFEQLDLNTLLIVAERMKERKLAPVMAKMNPEIAKEVTVQLSKLRDLPVPGTMFVQ